MEDATRHASTDVPMPDGTNAARLVDRRRILAGSGSDGDLGLPKIAAPSRQPTIRGFVDRMADSVIEGWALDPMAPRKPLVLRVIIDGIVVDTMACDGARTDTGLHILPSDRVGFRYQIPAAFQDGKRHVLRFATLDGLQVVLPSRSGFAMAEFHFCLRRETAVQGVLDGVVDGLFQGWALRNDADSGGLRGGVRILVSSNGQPLAELLADQFRPDVGDALDADPVCGFAYSPPAELGNGARLRLAFHALPEQIELRGSPIEITLPTAADRGRIEAMIERVDDLFAFAYQLRRDLKAALPAERYTLADYPRWAAKSMPRALERATARYGDLPDDRPLVSILCPVFRPMLADFLAAVDSVRQQTYGNWELILVDDGSGDSTLSAAIGTFARAEPRIRAFAEPQNRGIGAATSRAMAEARGQVVAFFDHDDLLEPGAIEIMLRAREATGARLLYSDEDKVDRSGALSEPHLKPDFNPRLLLDINYICHFVMVDVDIARAAGAFDPAFDGAQDHDFLLRVTELVRPDAIHHVPEILYHWRKSARSTAASGQAKPKAGEAGRLAVSVSLQRRGRPAKVEQRGGLTCYRIDWRHKPKAKRSLVSILIPFRDHADMTAACVEAIRRVTRDVRYEIVLLDNWSRSTDVEAFCATEGNRPDTRILRIEEPFNFSRINNQGALAATGEFLLFLNNDVIVSDPAWLRRMTDEALADEAVGAVGAKLLYPNGTVQHAGVVIGVGGIADHAFRGMGGDAPGYVARAMVAQDVSAVTAACMLVRRTAFEAVGGFDEDELKVAFNDVDLCLKFRARGWRVIWTPDVVAEHRESMSRGDDFDASRVARFMFENEVMKARWGGVLAADPFYNRHFSRDGGVYRDLRLLDSKDAITVGKSQRP